MVSPAANVNTLNARIDKAAGSAAAGLRLRNAVANTVLAQLTPKGAVKGGTAMKLRLGSVGSRFTPDFDVARHGTLEEFLADFEQRLTSGWGGFTGRVVKVAPPEPEGVPVEYIMAPYDVKLAFKGRSWRTVRLELGPDELGDTQDPVELIAADLVGLFAQLGLDEPKPAPVLAVHHQIAQKLHACSGPGSERAHDLVDLQCWSVMGNRTWSSLRRRLVGFSGPVGRTAGRRKWLQVRHGRASTRRRPRSSTCCRRCLKLWSG